MTAAGLSTIDRWPVVRPQASASGLPDRWIARRMTLVWALLFFNGLGSAPITTLLPIPRAVEQLMTAGSLAAALIVAMGLNRRALIRPNLVLGLSAILVVVALMASVRTAPNLGTAWRCIRFGGFVAVLWLLTPWWGRRDLLLARCHLRVLLGVSAIVAAGLLVGPSRARPDGRLVGIIWPIPAPQVAEYAAVAAGMVAVLWLSGSVGHRRALLLGAGEVAIILLTQTRTALLALAAGVAVTGLSLFVARRRVRRVVTVIVIVAPMLAAALAPAFSAWYTRGQSTAQINDLTGRRTTWEALLAEQRTGLDQWIGLGLSNKSFGGHPIDNDWLAVYQDEGLVGDGLVALSLLILVLTPALRPPGPARSLAIFIAVYCAVASYTEVGLGDASPYLLHATVAASLLAATNSRLRLRAFTKGAE